MEIPITISLKGNKAELDRDFFGLGEEVKDPEILRFMSPNKGTPRYVNKETTITDGVTFTHSKKRRYLIAEAVAPAFVDYFYIISIIDTALGLGMSVYTITDWFLCKIQKHDCKIMINGKEVKTRDEFQKTLDEYINSNRAI